MNNFILSLRYGRLGRFALFAITLLVSGCSKPIDNVNEVRPVRVIKLTSTNAEIDAEFAGEVRARIESRLGFRVGGKIVSRAVEVGSLVKSGQILMQLDPLDQKLAQAQAVAALTASESNRDLASAELKRYLNLRDKNFVSQAVLDSKEGAFKSAEAAYEQSVAINKSQSNQVNYTTLVANADGVVTNINAEVGQVVVAGADILRVAELAEKEVVIGIPENKVDTLRTTSDVQVRIWAHPKDLIAGKIREISPIADPATRTFITKVSLIDAPADVHLGMTAYVIFSAKSANQSIKVPLTALFQDKGSSAVWVVENNLTKLTRVEIGAPIGNDIILTGGVSNGQMVVTAGVNSLKQGQRVRVLDEEPVTNASSAAAAAGTGAVVK
ncbi:efflux RND transporter periplasmic adaptor subunit [Solimicrobium silvestre]|uniref:Efflux transporter, RND family, MFP subunit n=1 Tax=Solimicrobium silvestre TaxID=2099400 RepID=A0A2S9H0M3_9BURK|nr:efflux RND transporter periplasmic adaptor subunit [Solimicrobium silvestre]PRC93517.1 Efflux transporter, RND family, MFP subunit [Solimicrobium silvestre]